MFTRILVPMDQTARADEALEAANRLARRTGASLVLVHVEQPVTDLARTVGAEQELARRVKALRDEGMDASYVVRYGRAEQGIAEAVGALGADLVVMAPHRRAGLDALAHPSVTARMFARSQAPILVWPEKAPGQALAAFLNAPGGAVIVALDGSDLAERALPFAQAFAREYVQPLLIVRSVTPLRLTAVGPETPRLEREARAQQEHEARHYLSGVRRRLLGQGPTTVQSMVLHGQPERELLRLAETHEGSLLVLGTHGRTGLNRLLMGSVAATLMRNTPLPLLVVPRDARVPAEATAREQASARQE